MGDRKSYTNPNGDILVEIALMPPKTIRASTAQDIRKLVPPVVVRTRDPRVIYGFGEANFQFYVKVTLCNPVDGAAIDDEDPHVGGASQMITQRHIRNYTFDMKDPYGPYVYFVFRDLHLERLGEFQMNISMQVVDYRPGMRTPRGQPLRYGGEAFTWRFTVVEHAITNEPKLLLLHRDLEMRNIFVHFEEESNVPDFYIGDFGSAIIGPFAPGTGLLLRDIQALHETVVRLLNCPSTSGSLGAPLEDGLEGFLRDWLSKLYRLAFPEGPDSRGTVLPDLELLLNDIAAMTAPVPRIRRTPAALSLPLCHDTREAAENVSQIHGPWYLARVRNDSISGLPEVVEVDEGRTYHRPNRHNSESDTDDGL
ncbi:hypothetical protein VP1G_03449 [Cytospora mali]|uniref:Protein kinase domain-containing protein n=1 Tax=Cytospora mali TaxID=578113 RepID=A0A194UWX1_CYTMA|nr:hypothetical protein VP1G_03449 [Valsa mali var. pyri (nom. inval.)]